MRELRCLPRCCQRTKGSPHLTSPSPTRTAKAVGEELTQLGDFVSPSPAASSTLHWRPTAIHPCMFRSVFADPKLAAQYGGLHVNAVVTRTRKPRGGAANAGCANRTAKHPVCRAYFAGLHRTVADWASDSRSDRLDGKARTEPGERLNKRSQPLAGSIQHPKGACWIVKPVAECPVRSGVPPVRRGPRVRSSG